MGQQGRISLAPNSHQHLSLAKVWEIKASLTEIQSPGPALSRHISVTSHEKPQTDRAAWRMGQGNEGREWGSLHGQAAYSSGDNFYHKLYT